MSAERFSLDTNVLVYAADHDAGERHERALEIIERSARRPCTLTLQALGEFFFAATRKGIVPKAEAAQQVRDWLELFPAAAGDTEALEAALNATVAGRFSFSDAMLLATAGRAGCVAVLSEDMGDGAALDDVVVRNPFIGPDLPQPVAKLLGS